MVYYEQPKDKERPPGCLDALIITRAMLGIVLIPFLVLMGIVVDIAAALALYSLHPALALIPLALTIGAVWAYARWERRKYGPPDE